MCMALTSVIFALSAFCVKMLHGSVPVFQVCRVHIAVPCCSGAAMTDLTYMLDGCANLGWPTDLDQHGNWHGVQIVLVRSSMSALLAAASIARMKHTDNELTYFGQSCNRRKLLARGMTGACAMTLYYFSIQYLPLGDAVTVFFTNVVRICSESLKGLHGFARLDLLFKPVERTVNGVHALE